MGCQKGAAWSRSSTAPERVLHPLKRVGERGDGKWQQVSWDEALTEIADHMLDAIEESGPETIIDEGTPGEGGLLAKMMFGRLDRPARRRRDATSTRRSTTSRRAST